MTGSAKDFKRLVRKGTFDASWTKSEITKGENNNIAYALCALRTVTAHAAAMLLSSGITCLDLRSHSHLVTLPAQDLCKIAGLTRLECADCPQLLSPPPEIGELGGAESMNFLRECDKNGAYNKTLALFLVGGGENGKTSVLRALMSKTGNSAQSIGIDFRTVGMDEDMWETTDSAGRALELQTKDVGGQDLYMHLHELFVLSRGLYLFVWRADRALEKTRQEVTAWLNLLQARVPGVAVLAVVTHADCVSADVLQQQSALVKDAFEKWQAKQQNAQKAHAVPVVRVLNHGKSYAVDCQTGEGIPELRSALLCAAEETRGFREPLPRTWIDLRQKLGEMKKTTKYMGWTDFTRLVKECNIPDKMLLALTAFLHETSVVRFFGLPLMRRQADNFEDFLTVLLGGTRDSAHVEGARALFDRIDTDGSGAIDEKELREFMLAAGLKPTDANVKLMMQSVDDDSSGKIEFEEFRKRFDNAQGAVNGDVLSSTVYLNANWMVDILKGVIRHDHAALHEFLQSEKMTELMHQARRLRVQGIISRALLEHNLLWPGMPSVPFWCKVASDSSTNYTYEKSLWDDGAGGLKTVVESEEDKIKAMALLEGFKIILPKSPVRLEFLCPDLVPPHTKRTSNSVSLDAVSCEYYLVRTFIELPFGFWNILFMEIQRISTSGSVSTHIQTHFQLSAKIQIMQTAGADGNIRIDLRASTSSAFKAAQTALAKVFKFYPGMASWEASQEDISAEDSAKIIEPAQVLVMTAAALLNTNADVLATFNDAMAQVEGDLDTVKTFIEEARTKPAENEVTTNSLEKLSRNFDRIEPLLSRLKRPDADPFAGTILLADMRADVDGFVNSAILPEYGRCLREVKRRASAPPAGRPKNSQVVDASSTPSIQKLDKALFKALKKRDSAEARRLLHQGADPSDYTSSSCCFGSTSSVAEANKVEDLIDLLHSFGCVDSDLKKSNKTSSRRGHAAMSERLRTRLGPFSKRLESFSQPRAMLPKFLEEDTLMSSMKWIETLYGVIDTHFPSFCISKEIYSPYSSLFDGRAQVVLVLLDEATSRSEMLCDRFRELELQGCKIIGVPMPGYKISNYSKWWPESMEAFRDHSLFFDCRWAQGDELKGKMRNELMPQMHQFLEEWKPPHSTPGAETIAHGSGESGPHEAPEPGPLETRVYASKEALRKCVLPCPCCLQLGKPNPGTFNRDDCMLFFMSKDQDTNTKGTLFCLTCQQKVKVKDILKRLIFLSYNWGFNNSTQKIATLLCERIFLQTEMPYWLDVDGGMSFGDELGAEMREGVAGCEIVLLMFSNAFVNSGNCLCEFLHTVKNKKYIIPVLVPDKGGTRTGPSGWTGAYTAGDKGWWKHAQDIFDLENPDFGLAGHPMAHSFKDMPWDYLENFTPIDMRGEILKDDGSLLDDSAAECEIIRRVMSRFFRSHTAA